MVRYLAFLFITLASVGFFNYHALLTPTAEKLVFYISVLSGGVVAMMYGLNTSRYKYPRLTFAALIAFMIISSLLCGESHMQSAIVTLKASLPMILAFSCFYIFMRLQVTPNKVIITYICLCVVSTIVFFCNMFTMPNNIFGQPVISEDFSRGIVRVYIVFIEIYPLLVFYSINKYLESKEKKWLFIMAWLIVMIFLSVIRQIIAATAILGLWFYFNKVSLTKKLSAILMVVLVVFVVLPQIPIYKTMIELSEDQRDDNEQDENIRIKAWRYYTYENQPSALTVIFGNGVPSLGNSTWGVQFDSDTEVTGCYAADVGWAGFFYYFGATSTLCLLLLLITALLKKKPLKDQYLNYWLIFILLTSMTSGPILYYYQIVNLTVVLYLVFTSNGDEYNILTEKTDECLINNRVCHIKQCKKYPQLR